MVLLGVVSLVPGAFVTGKDGAVIYSRDTAVSFIFITPIAYFGDTIIIILFPVRVVAA